ncbi:MAG TPA: response regulator transcription factor [Bacteroidales bacterium]|nr:response regulator transcription factor [Bacteroidales bacterium]HPS73687.1 response regulator transcription factor [Bacteroidales bacterium]
MEKIRLFLVDDHQLVRDGVKALLTGITDMEIVGEANTGKELLEKIDRVDPDIILMDISLPDYSGIDLTRMLTKTNPHAKILVLSMYTSEDFIINALKAGARGYLPKNTSRHELLDAIYTIFTGQEFLASSASHTLMKSIIRQSSEKETEVRDLHLLLSEREIEVLKLYSDGMNNKEIGERLNISIRTVESHKNHIVRKLGLKSTVDMVKVAIRNKITEL